MTLMDNIHVADLARYLSYLDPEPPMTSELDQWGSRYKSQKIHMYIWIRNQPNTGKGAYSRAVGNTSGKVMYNRFLNPGGLLWLAEALGEEESTLRKAVETAVAAEKEDYRKRCIAFRQVIPWERIMELLGGCEKWRYDRKIKSLLEIDIQTGFPAIKKGKRRRYLQILDEEENGNTGQTSMKGIKINPAIYNVPVKLDQR